ncbi:MAG: response regulator [Sulfuricellaceae bacterium]
MMPDTPFTILIVDDNPDNLYTLEALLRRLNQCAVVQAQSGEAALVATLEHAVHLILLDVQMPGMDGYETARHLKMTARTRDIPIIFLTAVFKSEEFAQRGFAAGAVDYLTKPLDDNQLLNRIALYRSLFEREIKLQEALEKLQRNEAMLVHQSRLAAMGQMVGAIAHQWRQPLNALALTIQDVKDAYEYGELNESYIDEMVSKSMRQIEFMSKTIDDFRNFFKPDQRPQSYIPRQVVAEAVELVSAQLQAHNISIGYACVCAHDQEEKCSLACIGFPSELKQVLLNILSNAFDAIAERQHTPGFRGRIAITIKPQGSCGIIAIDDNGGGIAPEVLERIYDPFFTTKEEGKGTGIGLYMSKMIVEEHMGGKLSAEKIPDGTRFVIDLTRNGKGLVS